MSRQLQITLITLACFAGYFGLRSLPVEKCEFLHYGDYVNSEGVIEGCGYEETEFFVMSEIRFPILAELTPLTEPVIGQSTQFQLTLFTTTGKPIKWEEIAISHTERIHAMVIDPSLEDYQHVHPQPSGPAGHYQVEITPRKAGPYAVYLDFIPLLNSRRTLLETGFAVAGIADAPSPGSRLDFKGNSLQFKFLPENQTLQAGEELTFKMEVQSDDGSPVLFSPIMDSYAHVVAFDEAGSGFAHLHPLNPFIEGQDPLNPDLQFTFLFDQPGYYRVWAQLIVNEEHTFVPFDLLIGEG